MDKVVDAEYSSGISSKIGLKKTFIWYLIGTLVVLWLVATGSGSDGSPSYYNHSDDTPWWSPARVLGSALLALVIPLPHILIACLFKSRRNSMSLLRICRGWYQALLAFCLAGSLASLVNKNSRENVSAFEPRVEAERPPQGADSEVPSDDIFVVHSKQSDQDFANLAIGVDAIGLLEKNYRETVFKGYSKQLEDKGLSKESLPKVTNSRLTSIDVFSVPVGVASVWLSSQTAEGELKSKYIFMAGVVGKTLHTVICSQIHGDNINLMISPKCQSKLNEVFHPKDSSEL